MKVTRFIAVVAIGFVVMGMISGCQEPEKPIEPVKQIEKPSEVDKPREVVADDTRRQAPLVKPPVVVNPRQIEAGPAPVIQIENPKHDFGTIGPNKSNICVFKFKNVGEGTLKISKISATCGCTVPELKKKEYAPGESGEVSVAYRSASYPGKVTKHLFINSNDPKTPRAELTIIANIELKVSFTPKKLEMTMLDTDKNSSLKLKSTDGVEFSIKSVSTPGKAISFDFDPLVKATSFEIKPTIDQAQISKWLTGNITIGLTHPECTKITIPYSVKPCLDISQQRIIIQNAEPEKTVTRKIIVKNNCSDDFIIKSITSSKGYMKVISQEKQGNAYTLEIEITPPARESKVRRYITDR